MPHYEVARRSITKTITYRIAVTICNAIIVYVVTTDVALAFNISVIIAVANTIVYYFHERTWNNVEWGKGTVKKSKTSAKRR